MAVIRCSRALAVLLMVVLLVNQSLSYGYQKMTFAAPDVQALNVDDHDARSHDTGKDRDAGLNCSHGCHLHYHFLGQIVRPVIPGLPPLTEEKTAKVPVLPIPTASLEPPYRPPRQSWHA